MKRTLLVVACCFLAAALHAADSAGFGYTLPPGWIDLVDPSVDASRFPANTVNEARSGKYRIYAVDPNNLSPRGANALFNVIETPQSGVVTIALLDRSMKEATALARAQGFTWTTLDMRVTKLGDVDIGVADSTIGNEAGTLRLVQYFIPGRTKAAVLTYGAMPEMFSQYQPIFETSAMATTGAYAHGFNWRRAMKAAFLGAVGSLLLALIGVAIVRRSARSPAPAPAAASQPAAVAGWDCPTCKRRVPGRIEVCRCGATRPS